MLIAINQQKESMIWGLDEEQLKNTDVEESLASYEHFVTKEVNRVYPAAQVSVTFDNSFSGVEVFDVDDTVEADEISESVDRICQRVFESGEFWS